MGYRRITRDCAKLAAIGAACAALAIPAQAAKKSGKTATPPPPVEQLPRVAPLPKPWTAQRFSLANGLRVVVHTDRTAPLVAVGVLVDVGSRDEQSGQSGLAHFFEHMMFQGSQRVGKMEHIQVLEAQGGEVNANTTADRTWYYQAVPRPALELVLWLEAERFANLKIDATNVDNQRQAVLAEMAQRYDNQPLARSQLAMIEQVFDSWALKHPTIGDPADLKAAPLQAFVEFWKRWYAPENCVLVLSGDIDAVQARPLVEATLGRVKARGAIERPAIAEPPTTAHRFASMKDGLTQAPAVHLAWKIPAQPTAEAAALDLLAQILGGGEASRLEKRLVREKALVSSYYAATHGRRDHDVFQVYAELTDPSTPALQEVKRRIRQEILAIGQDGVTADELQRARTAYEASWVNAASSPTTRAELLATYEAWHGDANKLSELLPRYRAVTPQAIQQAARTWLRWDREAEVDALPTAMTATKMGAKPEWAARAEKLWAVQAARPSADAAPKLSPPTPAEPPPPAGGPGPAPAAEPAAAPAPAVAPPADASPAAGGSELP